MKNITLALCMLTVLSACSTTKIENVDRNNSPEAQAVPYTATATTIKTTPCSYTRPQVQTPAGYTYTVSEPVEVIYKNTTYKTIYEPKTYSSTAYVKKPYSCVEGSNCRVKMQNTH